jgi:broad specificity phosphatase PhoE
VSSTRLLLVRHGESQVTVRRVVGGELTCSGLSPLGVRQAVALRDRFENEGRLRVDAMLTSTLPRAYETAELLAPAVDAGLTERDPSLVEHRPGEADGIAFTDYAARYGAFDLRAHPERPLAPGGESLNDFHHRVINAFAGIEQRFAGGTVLVVCHGGVIDVMFREYLGVGMHAPFDLWTLNTSITEFAQGPHRWMLRRYNDTAHLVGLPAKSVG